MLVNGGNVKEPGTGKSLYHKVEKIKDVDEINANGSHNAIISEDLKLDYNEYNDLIRKFVSVYGLNDAESTLTVNMYIDVNGSCDNEDGKNTESVISMVIPLTTKTVGIDIKNNIIEANESVLVCNDATSVVYLYLLFAGIIITMDVVLTLDLIRYILSTRTAENIYDIELKKILNNYHSYIQKVGNTMNMTDGNKFEVDKLQTYKGCQFFKLETFTDMLEIRDSINAPILMSTNAQNTATYFIILDVNNKAVYLYGIRVTDIKKQMKEKMMD